MLSESLINKDLELTCKIGDCNIVLKLTRPKDFFVN